MSDMGNDTIIDTEQQTSSRNDTLTQVEIMKLPKLKQELESRKLRSSENEKELQDRLRVALILLAELFVSYEKCRNWLKMKQILRFKFSQAVDAHKIHKELSRRTKKVNVSHQKYIYKMLEIAKQPDMKIFVLVKYVVDGIQDNGRNKMILYGEKSV
ncbi:hypothetical protein ANTQUA_LOCUS6980 [Anthophora quadrimaculata]